MKRTNKLWQLLALLAALTLVVAACGDADVAETTTTEAAEDPATTEAMDDTTTSEAMEEETTTTAAEGEEMDFGDPVTLNLGHPFPGQHPIQVGALEPFAEAVNEQTEGAVTIEFQPGGALAAAPATFENTVAGGQELGWALQGYHAGLFPATEIIEQPFQFESAVQATQTLWDLYDQFPAIQEEYSDVQLIGLWTHDVGDIWTKDVRVETTEDMQGLNMRFPSGMMSDLMSAMGASPIGMPAPEIFDSLSTGVIDGLSIAVSGLESFQLYPELAYGTQCNCYVAAQYLVANESAWANLTPDAQQVILDLGREYSLQAAEVYDQAYAAISQKAVDEGIEIIELPDDEYQDWLEFGQQVTDAWIAEVEEMGIPGQEMWDALQEIKGNY